MYEWGERGPMNATSADETPWSLGAAQLRVHALSPLGSYLHNLPFIDCRGMPHWASSSVLGVQQISGLVSAPDRRPGLISREKI